MADQPAKRWVLISMIHGAIERTEEQIAELKTGGLFTREASGPDDSHDNNPAPAAPPPPPVKPADKPAA
jgi:hypothetical protein